MNKHYRENVNEKLECLYSYKKIFVSTGRWGGGGWGSLKPVTKLFNKRLCPPLEMSRIGLKEKAKKGI